MSKATERERRGGISAVGFCMADVLLSLGRSMCMCKSVFRRCTNNGWKHISSPTAGPRPARDQRTGVGGFG